MNSLLKIGVLFFGASALAQVAPPVSPAPSTAGAAGDSLIELSPFVISSSTETGWVATETLAGSRLRTNFKDVPNQIETLTKEFMDDLALTNSNQALIYTANAENKDEFMSSTTKSEVQSPQGSGRVRGIGGGTLSRNFFQVGNQTDNFNLERVTLASGPNAILFGLGSPAGIIDATPARAEMRNKYGFTLQYDSQDSKRGTYDANVLVVPQKLALRLMGMSKREYTEKRPNLDRDERVYGAVTFKPFASTTVILEGEKDKRNWNRAGRILPDDNVSLWLRADQIAGSGYTVPRPVFNNSNLAGIATNRIFTQASEVPVVINSGVPVPTRSWRNSVIVKNPSQLPTVDQTFDAGVTTTVLDPSVFPFNENLLGSARATLIGAITKTAIIEQKLARNLFLELAYNFEKSYNHEASAGGASGGNSFEILVDPNQFIPGSTTPNPNFGKLYTQGGAGDTPTFERREDWRATISYELDLGRILSSRNRWGKWLGRHRFSGLYTQSAADSKSQQGFNRRILDEPVIPGVTLRAKTNRNWASDPTRVVQFRNYYDSSFNDHLAAGSMLGDWSLTDANGRPYKLHLFDTPLVSPDGKRLAAQQVASGNLTEASAQIFAWQGFFLPDREKRDRLVLTYGYRKDSAKSATLDDGSVLQDFSGLFPVLWDVKYGRFGPTQSGINRNIGVVLRPLKWLTAFYNQSTTFDLNIGRYDPFGHEIPGAGGKGKDYGLRLDFWQDKVALRINKYENTLGPQRAVNAINVFRDIYYNIEQRVLALDPGVPTINVTDGNKRGFRVAGRPNYFIMSELAATGYEVELNVTPTRSWNIRLNGSKSKAVESSIGGPWFAWGAARLPVWQGVVAKNGEVDAAGRPVTWQTAPYSATAPTGQTLQQYHATVLLGQAQSFMKAADGRSTANARGGRANLITNYRFVEGRLKGFNLGGAMRWRPVPTVGYGTTTSSGGTTILNLDHAYKGEDEFYVDAVVGYRGRMKMFGGFSYRLQLNVRNLLNDHDPIPTTRLSTGAVAQLATIEPRLTVITFGMDF